jgi:predicted N-acetyltransferase YhbS
MIRQATAADVPELGRILFEAFRDISEQHGFPSDFPSIEFAQAVSGLLIQREDVYSIAATESDTLRGSNHMQFWGDAAGIGPISVDVAAQGGGIGKALMLDALSHARASGYEMVRLCQDSFNMRSLALYASLGFDVKEPIAYMALSPAGLVDAAFRPMTAADFDAMDALCRDIYRISRKGEYAAVLETGFPSFVLERGGRITGYLIGTAIGHGVAQSETDMLTLLASMGASMPDAHAFIPLRNGSLYRAALAAGHRNTKVMNLMAYGPYEEPNGTFVPSVML